MINFIGLRRYFAAISLVLLIPSFVALAVWQLNPGIDFQGGLEMEVRFLQGIDPATVETAPAWSEGVPTAIIAISVS